jgi:hypothetical protein
VDVTSHDRVGSKKRVFTVFRPFSPFSTVFAGAADPESFGISSAWRTAPFFAPLKNGENGENGGRHV